jgi:prolyl 4-hydroxylase
VDAEQLSGSDVFVVHDFLTAEECTALIARGEQLGFEPASISYATGAVFDPTIRDNDRTILDDPDLAAAWWERVRPFLPERIDRWLACGVSARFKYYRYDPGQKFAAHRDGRVVHDDEVSQLTFMVYLNGEVGGGETDFPPLGLSVRPEAGKALLFKHKLLHEGAAVLSGRKYVIRTDVMYRKVVEDEEA